MDIENKIKELEAELNKIKESLKTKPSKRKKPAKGIMYWYVGCDNEIGYDCWRDTDTDNNIFNNYNCFLTREEAEKAQRVRETENMLRRYIEEHDTVELDWNNENQYKYCLYYSFTEKEIKIDHWYCCVVYPRAIYASNEQVLLDAIEAIGKDRITEYVQY